MGKISDIKKPIQLKGTKGTKIACLHLSFDYEGDITMVNPAIVEGTSTFVTSLPIILGPLMMDIRNSIYKKHAIIPILDSIHITGITVC